MTAALAAPGPGVASPTWQWFNFAEPKQVFSVAADDSILLVQGPNGLFRTRSGGFTVDTSLMVRDGDRITALARFKRKFFAATGQGIRMSGNAGLSWISVWSKPGPGAPAGNVIGFRSNGDSLWAVLAPSSGPEQPAYRMLSLDGGHNWGAPLEWPGAFAYDPVQVGDALLAVGQGTLHRSRDGGKSWSPVPVDPDVGPIRHLSFSTWGVHAATAGGSLVESFDGIHFHRIALGASASVWVLSMAADGNDLCATAGGRSSESIECSRDGGIPGPMRWENPFSGAPNLTLSRGFVYATASRDFAEGGIWRGDLATGSGELLEAPEVFGPYAPMLSARNDTLLALSRNPAAPFMISLDKGRTWDSLPGRPEGIVPDRFFQSDGLWGVSGPGEDFSLTLSVSRDRGASWSRFPSNPAALIRDHPVVAWDGQLYVSGDQGGLWKGDLRTGAWSLVEAPESSGFNSLWATDRALYRFTGDGYWRLERELPTASRPSARRSPARGRGKPQGPFRSGPGGIRVIPGPATGVEPGAYDLKGARLRD